MSKRVTFAPNSDTITFYDFSPVDVKSKVIVRKPIITDNLILGKNGVARECDKENENKKEREKCCSRMVRLLFGPKM